MYAMGLGDWIYHTDNGSTIEDPGGGIRLWTNKNDELAHLKKWYFYNEHIMGEYRPDINDYSEIAYFILNELNGDLKTYNTKELFSKAIRTQQLEPIFWTRWYHDHFTFVLGIYLLWIFYWPIISCIALFVCLCIFGSFAFKNKILKIIFTAITLFLLIPPILFMLKDYFTNSI